MQFTIILAILLLAIIVPALFFWHRHTKRKKIIDALQYKTFLIKIPLEHKEEEVDPKLEIAVFEQLLSSLSYIKKPIFFETAVSFISEEIGFYAAVPNSIAASFVKQILSLWGGAEVEQIEDYNIFNYDGEAVGAYLSQSENFVLPIRTYAEVSSDTFLPILGGFSKIDEIGEGGAIQIAVKPAEHSYKKRVKEILKSLKKGDDLKDALKKGGLNISDFHKLFLAHKENDEKEEKHIDENAVKALEAKLNKPFFRVNFRIVASAPTKEQANEILEGISSGFAQFGAPLRNELSIIKPRNIKELIHDYSFRRFNEKRSMVLNTEELSSIFHFPSPSNSFPRVKYLKAREAPPPDNLPKNGLFIGKSVFRGSERDVKMQENDRLRHFYIIGQTGTGKTKFMQNMIVQDIRNGKGVAVVDPHGDLVDDVASLIPENRFDDVIIFDPGDVERPIGINMLEYDFSKPEQKTFITNELIGIFDKLYDLKATGGPIFEQYFRNALMLLLEDAPNEPVTLMEVERVFTDSNYRRKKLDRIINPTVQDFWIKMAEKAGGEAALANVVPYITSKLTSFTANDFMRGIVGQVNSAFNLRRAMDEGKIILINLSKGRLGNLNASLLGLIFVGKILMAAFSRFDIPQEQRKEFYLYIDEFQNFTTDSISEIFAEARKYRLSLTVAHQFIAQLEEKIRDSVFGNVGSIASFRVSTQDAEFLSSQFKPTFKENDLINIANFNAYVRLLINNDTNKPFNIKAPPLEKGDIEKAQKLKELSRIKYGKDRKEVEEAIYKRLRE